MQKTNKYIKEEYKKIKKFLTGLDWKEHSLEDRTRRRYLVLTNDDRLVIRETDSPNNLGDDVKDRIIAFPNLADFINSEIDADSFEEYIEMCEKYFLENELDDVIELLLFEMY